MHTRRTRQFGTTRASVREVERSLDAIHNSLHSARVLTDRLFELVSPTALYKRPIPERHRLIFYVGHLEAFDWNMISRVYGGEKPVNAEFDRLFEFGIDPLDRLPSDRESDWPSVSSVLDYRMRTRQAVDHCLKRAADGDLTIFFVALEHRLMHAETLTYLLHRLPAVDKLPIRETIIDGPAPDQQVVGITEGEVTLGRARDESDEFGWDNEYSAQTVHVAEFQIDVHNVTNQQFLKFVGSGGYEDPSYWDEAAWNWIKKSGIGGPNFWKHTASGWMYETMFGAAPLPMAWPVYVSHAEAAAYARWCRRSLPTEAQYHRAAFGTPDWQDERLYPWGNSLPVAEAHGNFGSTSWNPLPVGFHRAGFSAWGVSDMMSNGWEWTSTEFAPFPGFEPFPFYPQYSAGFFDGSHYVLKGASPRTPSRLLRRTFRNWFQPHYPNIYATFRCIDN